MVKGGGGSFRIQKNQEVGGYPSPFYPNSFEFGKTEENYLCNWFGFYFLVGQFEHSICELDFAGKYVKS